MVSEERLLFSDIISLNVILSISFIFDARELIGDINSNNTTKIIPFFRQISRIVKLPKAGIKTISRIILIYFG